MFLVFYQIQERFQEEQINKTELVDSYYRRLFSEK